MNTSLTARTSEDVDGVIVLVHSLTGTLLDESDIWELQGQLADVGADTAALDVSMLAGFGDGPWELDSTLADCVVDELVELLSAQVDSEHYQAARQTLLANLDENMDVAGEDITTLWWVLQEALAELDA